MKAEANNGEQKKKKKRSKQKHGKDGSVKAETTAESTANLSVTTTAQPAQNSAGNKPAGSMSKPTVTSAQWNFEAEYNDHFETPRQAYVDISAALQILAESLGKTKEDLVIYDPYYCKGNMVSHLSNLGFNKVLNFNRDFYKDIATKAVPDFDILVTNPPYSGEHKQKLLTYLSNRRVKKPFALLLPAYTVTKSYWRDFVSTTENLRRKQLGADAASGFMYVLPASSYNYEHPEGTGHTIPPFYSAWLIGGFPDMNSVRTTLCESGKFTNGDSASSRPAIGSSSVTLKRARPGDCTIGASSPTIVSSVDAIVAGGFVSGEKRPNPKGRKRRKGI